MSEWLESAITRAQGIDDWLAPKRTHALELLSTTKWPTRKTEAWRYTPLRAVERSLARPEKGDGKVSEPIAIADLAPLEIVFVDGQFDNAQLASSLPQGKLPDGLSIALGSELSASEQDDALQAFSTIKPERHLFGLVNDALAQDVVVVRVAANANIAQPVRITSLRSQHLETHTRVQVVLEESARLTVIEDAQAQGESLSTAFVEYDVAPNAHLEHYRFALQTGSDITIGGSHFKLHDHSAMNSTIVGFGSELTRVDTDIIHAGEHADAKLNAMYLLDGKELFDLHATVEHAMPNGTTLENVRGIVADRARAVFNGRIHIHRDAQKTLAELNNRNLLMSDKAEINTKPELEIYADDVKCAHGATVAEIDKQALYYLQTRGVSRSKAQVMLNFGFINELIDLMPNAALAEWVRPIIRERFAQMEVK